MPASEDPTRPSVMPVAEVMERWRPGSYDDPWSWQNEADDLWSRDGGRMDALAADVQVNGVREPVSLGDDGRVWDGHHRIVVAYTLDIERIPVDVWEAP